jgi:hypothetical protein
VNPPFNVPQFKVFPHLMFNFNDPKSIISMLNVLHSRCSNLLFHKETLNGDFTVLNSKSGCVSVQVYFSSLASQVKFLCNVIAYHGGEHAAVGWPELRLRCLRLVAALLRQSDDSISWAVHLKEPVVPALMIAAAAPLAPIRHAALDCLFILASSMGAGLDSNTYLPLLEAIKDRREEIVLDAE